MKRLPLLRVCGDCEACCKVLSVDEINKPEGVACVHQVGQPANQVRLSKLGMSGGGCSIYKTRPAGCRSFQCLWLAEADPRLQKYAKHRKAPRIFAAADRPDISGILLHAPAKGGVCAVAREVWPGAADSPEGKAALERFGARHAVVLVRGNRRTLMGPEAETKKILDALGVTNPNVVEYTIQPKPSSSDEPDPDPANSQQPTAEGQEE